MKKRFVAIMLIVTLVISPLHVFASAYDYADDYTLGVQDWYDYLIQQGINLEDGYTDDYIPGIQDWYDYLIQQGINPEDEFPAYMGNNMFDFRHDYSEEIQPFAPLSSPLRIRENILVIDVSGSMTPAAMNAARLSAHRFVESALAASGRNYVAIVAFGANATLRAPLTTNPVTLHNAINGLNAGGGTAMNNGLLMAQSIFENSPNAGNPLVTRNVLLLSDGLPNVGATSVSGPFSSPMPSWQHANAVYNTARSMINRGTNIHTLGFFHGLSGATLNFARIFKQSLQNRGYFDVTDPNDLIFVFDDIIDDMFGEIPIIVIPGIAGSSLIDADNGDVLWFSAWDMVPWVTRIPRLELFPDGVSVNNVSVGQIYGISEHPISGILTNYLLPYAQIMNDLRAAFPNRTVYFFPYDWRMDNAFTANRLSQFINHPDRNYPEVDIVAHSMGGLVAAQFIADGNADRVNNLITVGTPYLGSPKVPYAFLTGNLVDILPRYIDNAMRRISTHMPAVYQLLPFQAPPEIPYLAVRTGSIFNRQRTYIYADETHDFMANPNNFNMRNAHNLELPINVRLRFFPMSEAFMSGLFLSDGRHIIQTVDYYVIAGTGSQTIRTTILNSSGNHVDELEFYDGDGTVPFWSASIGGRVTPTVFPYAHLNLIFEENVINHIIDVLKQNPSPNAGVNPVHKGSVVIRIASPVETTVSFEGELLSSKDAYFNRVSSFGSLHFIGQDGDVEVFALAANNIYDVLIVGTGYGTMTYSISFFDTNGEFVENRIFVDVPITYNTIITTNTSQSNDTILSIDTNGDGEYDKILSPDFFYPERVPLVDTWDEFAIYQEGDIVLYNGLLYQARWRTQGDRPDGQNAHSPWRYIGEEILQWRSEIPYNVGEIVLHNGLLYQARWWTHGHEPDGQNATNHWRYIGEEILAWRSDIPYEYGAIVYFNGRNYIARNWIQPNTIPTDEPHNPWSLLE